MTERRGHVARERRRLQVEWWRRAPLKRCQLSGKKEPARPKVWGIESRRRNRGSKGHEAGTSWMRLRTRRKSCSRGSEGDGVGWGDHEI